MIGTAPASQALQVEHRRARWAAGVLALMALAACGGGGDSGSSAISGAGSPGAPSSPGSPAPAPAPAAAATATCGLNDFTASALARINQLRATGASCGVHGAFAPTTALAWNTALTQAGEGHSEDMAELNYFSHTSANGRTLTDRVNATGYTWAALGENIAAGYPTVNSVMDGWIASDGHCANLMNPSFTEVGLACTPGVQASSYNTYWTMDMARPR